MWECHSLSKPHVILSLHQSVYIPISEESLIVGRSKDSHADDRAEVPCAGAGSPAAADYGTAGEDGRHCWLELQTGSEPT